MKIISRLKGVLKQRLILGISIFQKKSLEWFKNYSLICKVDWNVYKTSNKTVVDPDLQFRDGRRGEVHVGPVWKKILFWPQFGLKIRGGGYWGYGGGGYVSRVPWYILIKCLFVAISWSYLHDHWHTFLKLLKLHVKSASFSTVNG